MAVTKAYIIKQASLLGLVCAPVATVTHVNHDRIERAVKKVMPHKKKRVAKPRVRSAARVAAPIPDCLVTVPTAVMLPTQPLFVPYQPINYSPISLPPEGQTQTVYRSPPVWGGPSFIPFPGGGSGNPGGGNPPPGGGNPPPAIPEPYVWMMMISGFAMTGIAVRAREKQTETI